jgi:hypothetical protein
LHPMSFNIFICLRNAALFTNSKRTQIVMQTNAFKFSYLSIKTKAFIGFIISRMPNRAQSSFSSLPTYNLETAFVQIRRFWTLIWFFYFYILIELLPELFDSTEFNLCPSASK